MQRAKFTLVELLVVIAIISILAGMLLPALRAAVDQARLTSCQAQLKQMAFATGMYEAEHGYYPPSLVDSFVGEPGGVTGWEDPKTALDLIFPYAPDRKLFFCPSLKGHPLGYSGAYGHNNSVCGKRILGTYNNPLYKSSRVSNPSQTLLMLDSGAYTISGSRISGPNGSFWYIPGTAMGRDPAGFSNPLTTTYPAASDFIDGRHSGGLNLAWCDGHTSWVSGANMYNDGASWFVP